MGLFELGRDLCEAPFAEGRVESSTVRFRREWSAYTGVRCVNSRISGHDAGLQQPVTQLVKELTGSELFKVGVF